MEISTAPYLLNILQPKAHTKAIQTITSHRHTHTNTHTHTYTHTHTHTHTHTSKNKEDGDCRAEDAERYQGLIEK